MSVGWSTEAKTALQGSGCRVAWRTYIDIETGTTPSHGQNIIEVSDYVMKLDKIERASMVIDKNFQAKPVVIPVDNSSHYFTSNVMAGARDTLTNIWQMRPSGEADPRDCILYIDQVVTLADNTTETKRRFAGMISELNFIIDRPSVTAEIIARSELFDKLDMVFTTEDGFSDSDPNT